MKLSELFQIAIEALDEDAQQELSFLAYPRHETRYDELKQSAAALRAIAPALVDFVLVAYAPHTCFPSKESCPICGLYNAMKKAGVSCE